MRNMYPFLFCQESQWDDDDTEDVEAEAATEREHKVIPVD